MQLPLPIELPSYQTLDNFYFEDNELLHDALVNLTVHAEQPHTQLLLIHGGSHSGKTHLATALYHSALQQKLSVCYLDMAELFAPEILSVYNAMQGDENAESIYMELLANYDQHELLIVENIHIVADQISLQIALFDLINRCIESKASMLLTSALGPTNNEFELPDLRSRLTWGQVYQLEGLSDAGLEKVVTDYVAMKGLNMQAAAINYLLKFTVRDIAHIQTVLGKLDQLALSEQKAITIPLIKKALRI
ncbi:MAG: DnaA/Hda family protein [Glaciecola sp.]|jgi:DnaA-homolog protein|nr:DnaA/Hda family protein [Glaciecola sp.]MDG1814734.1 DnaA/Hda family protein [Glaciecola sp.]MDG2099393.1 DnaA/Hda family protein [Glaciecola sp.]